MIDVICLIGDDNGHRDSERSGGLRVCPIENKKNLKIAYLIPDVFWVSTVTTAVEIFHSMNLSYLKNQSHMFCGIEVTLLRAGKKKVTGFSGISLNTRYYKDASLGDAIFDVILIPSIWNLSHDNIRRHPAALEWLALQHKSGSIVAGLVNGAFYLAEAGLLDGREATVHWSSENIIKQRYPNIGVTTDIQIIESDGVITTSCTTATMDLALLIIQRFLGTEAAEYASLYFGIRNRSNPVPEFLEPSTSDVLTDAVRDKVRMNCAEDLSLEVLAREFNVTAKTLTRHFNQYMQMSPTEYILKYRLDMARRLLQSTDFQMQKIAERTGFSSATVLGRNFKKMYGKSPRDYREGSKLADRFRM